MPAREGSHTLWFYIRYPRYGLRVFCPNPRCAEYEVVKRLDAFKLREKFPLSATLDVIAGKTWCRACGHRPGKLCVVPIGERLELAPRRSRDATVH